MVQERTTGSIRKAPSWNATLVASFNVCFFLGLVLLSLYGSGLIHQVPSEWYKGVVYGVVPLVNGALTAMAVYGIDRFLARRHYLNRTGESSREKLLAVAFVAGAAGIFMAVSPVGTFAASLLIVYATVSSIRAFARKMGELLQVGSVAGKKDVAVFFNFFLSLIITFAVINLSLNEAHHSLNLPWGFHYGDNIDGVVDSLYFTVITMVTVGFGDIVPQTAAAKLVVVIECLVSYVMLGLMIGIISRGVDFKK